MVNIKHKIFGFKLTVQEQLRIMETAFYEQIQIVKQSQSK